MTAPAEEHGHPHQGGSLKGSPDGGAGTSQMKAKAELSGKRG